MDWFQRLTGFREVDYERTRQQLEVDGDALRSRVNGRHFGIGRLETPSLAELRERVRDARSPGGRPRVRNVTGDARAMHRDPEYRGALFQVASQFNLLEMTGPGVTPEDGVGPYERDRTQGPACAIAAGAATVYRNYFVPVAGLAGQTRTRQIDTLADLGGALASRLGLDRRVLWEMRNGYAMCTVEGLEAIGGHLRGLDPAGLDSLRQLLRVGLQWDVEVTDRDDLPAGSVSQAFCSALPVAYSAIEEARWEPFARLVLEAAYEATLLAAAHNVQRGGSRTVLLTSLGGGAFGNDERWIHDAMKRAIGITADFGLDVKLVSYRSPPKFLRSIEAAFA